MLHRQAASTLFVQLALTQDTTTEMRNNREMTLETRLLTCHRIGMQLILLCLSHKMLCP